MADWHFIVLSNIVYILVALVLIIRSKQVYDNYYIWHFEIFIAMSIGFISAMYHLCDNGTDCIENYSFMIDSDYLFAMLILNIGFTVHLGIKFGGIYKVLVNFTSLVLVFFYLDSMSQTVIPILVINCIVVLGYNYHRWFFIKQNRIRRLIYLFCAITFAVIAYVLKIDGDDNSQAYNTYHPLWHIFTGLAFIFSTMAVMPRTTTNTNNNIKTSISTTTYTKLGEEEEEDFDDNDTLNYFYLKY